MTPARTSATVCWAAAYQKSVAVSVNTAPIVCAKRFAGPGEYRCATCRRGVTRRVATSASGLSFGPVRARATKPYARTGRIQPCWNAIATTASTATTPATSRAEVSLTGFGNEKRPRMTTRKSAYRSIASLDHDLSSCRACAEAGFSLESLPVRAPFAQQRAYLYGQAPGMVEGEERLPWRGRAGQTLRRWLDPGRGDVLRDLLLRVGDALLSRSRRVGPRRPHARAGRTRAVRVLAPLGARPSAAAPHRHGGQPGAAGAPRPPLVADRMHRRAVRARRRRGRPTAAPLGCEQLAEPAGEPRASRACARARAGGALASTLRK